MNYPIIHLHHLKMNYETHTRCHLILFQKQVEISQPLAIDVNNFWLHAPVTLRGQNFLATNIEFLNSF